MSLISKHSFTNDNIFSFRRETASRVPRAWDRVLRSSTNAKNKGRKIWKLRKPKQHVSGESASDEEQGSNHDAKRQCLKRMPAVPVNARRQRQYASTLHEQAPGTPKRRFIYLGHTLGVILLSLAQGKSQGAMVYTALCLQDRRSGAVFENRCHLPKRGRLEIQSYTR